MKTKITIMVVVVLTAMSVSATTPSTIAFVADKEGFRAKAYDDHGQMSIGYGTSTIYARRQGFTNSILTKEEARKLLTKRLQGDEQILVEMFPKWNTYPEGVRVAIASAYYNSPGLIGPNFTTNVKLGWWSKAADELTLGTNPKGKIGLVNRRYEEANMLLKAVGLPTRPTPATIKEFEALRSAWKKAK